MAEPKPAAVEPEVEPVTEPTVTPEGVSEPQEAPEAFAKAAIPLNWLAGGETFAKYAIGPGDEMMVLGYPQGKTTIKLAVPHRERAWWRRLWEKILTPFPNCNAVENRPAFTGQII